MKRRAKLFVLKAADGGDQIFFQKIGGTFRDLNSQFHIRFGKHVIEVCLGCNQDIWDLRFDGDQAANAILKRRKISFDVNVHVGGARIDHGISFEDRHILHFKEVLLHRGLQNSQVDGLAWTQFGWIELGQAIVKPPEPGKLGIKRQTAVIADFAVVFVKTESGSLKRMGCEIRFNVFLGYRFVFGIICLRSEARRWGDTMRQSRQRSRVRGKLTANVRLVSLCSTRTVRAQWLLMFASLN